LTGCHWGAKAARGNGILPSLFNHGGTGVPHIIFFKAILAAIILLLVYRPAWSTPPNIIGTYDGTVTENEFNCGTNSPGNPPLAAGGTDTDTLTLTISSQSGSNFSGSGSQSGDPDETISISFNGTVDDAGNISGSFTSSATFPGGSISSSGTFSGNISDGVMDLMASGSESTTGGFIACDFTLNGTLTLISSGGIIVNPEITPSTTLTAPLLLNTHIKTVTTNLGTRISDILRGVNPGLQLVDNGLRYTADSGLNAGDLPFNYGAWASYSYSDYDNDLSSTAFDGHTHSVLAGVDFAPWENTVLGIALGYENSDIDTRFNRGNQETDGFTVAPYFGWLLNDILSIDASVGWSWLDNDQFRTPLGTTTRITSSPDGDRWFGMLNLNGATTWNNWILGARTGFLVAKNTTDAFVESDGTTVAEVESRLGQLNIGGDIAYSLGEWEPFARLIYEYDYQLTEITVVGGGPQPSNDDDNFVVGAGIRYFNANGWTGNLEWNKRLGREDFDEDTITITIRGEF